MKTQITLLLLLLSVVWQPVAGQESSMAGNQLIVYGTGTITAQADRAVINFSVKGFGPTLDSAITVANQKVRDITSLLFSLGLKKENLTTSKFQSGDNFEGTAFLSDSRDYRAYISVSARIDSLDLLEPVTVAISKGPIETLSNITFVLKHDSTITLNARKLAVENAKVKARLMAEQLGITLGNVMRVEELLSQADGGFYLPDGTDLRRVGMATNMANTTSRQPSGPAFFTQSFSRQSGVKITFEIRNPSRANGN